MYHINGASELQNKGGLLSCRPVAMDRQVFNSESPSPPLPDLMYSLSSFFNKLVANKKKI